MIAVLVISAAVGGFLAGAVVVDRYWSRVVRETIADLKAFEARLRDAVQREEAMRPEGDKGA